MFGFVLTPKTILIALFENLRKSETHKLLFSAVQLIVMSCVCVVWKPVQVIIHQW